MPLRNVYFVLIVVLSSIFIVAKTSIKDQVVRNVARLVQRNSLSAPSEKTLYEGALAGILDAVKDEPYTVYLPPSEQPEYMREIQGRYAGVGLAMFVKDSQSGEFYFVPQRNSPASKAGLKFGDRIVEVDGQRVANMSVFELASTIRGEENTTVKLKIRPRSSVKEFSSDTDDSRDELAETAIVRAIIQQDVVLGDRLDDEDRWVFTLKNAPDIGYIAVEQFADATVEQTKKALDELEKKQVNKVILDFRGNPGGFLPDAVAICNELLAFGSPIVETRDRNGETHLYEATSRVKRQFKTAVLIDDESASASEIVASALQDAGVAVVVGSRSYGKGTVQSIMELPFNSGALRMTTASFWRPSGRPIQRNHDAKLSDEWGVMPNTGYEVSVSPLQSFYQKWIRRVRVSSRESNTFDMRVISFMTYQMETMQNELLHASPPRKAEIAAEIGLSLDEAHSMFGHLTPNFSASEVVTSGSEDDSPIPPDISEFKPAGEAPYFDPQLDKAIEYLNSFDSSGTIERKEL